MRHRHGLRFQAFGELGVLLCALFLYAWNPCRVHGEFILGREFVEDGLQRTAQVPNHGSGYMAVTVYLHRVDVELYELAVRVPLAVSAAQQPVEACAYEHHHIAVSHYGGTDREGAQRVLVGQDTLGH